MILNAELLNDMQTKGVNVKSALTLLDLVRSQDLKEQSNASSSMVAKESYTLPSAKDERIAYLDDSFTLKLEADELSEILLAHGLSFGGSVFTASQNSTITLSASDLDAIGIALYSVTAFCILNGGSSTSFFDESKNEALDANAFSSYAKIFSAFKEKYSGKAKSSVPAFIQKNSTPGPDFLSLKIRALLLKAIECRNQNKGVDVFNKRFYVQSSHDRLPLQLCQLTSRATSKDVEAILTNLFTNPMTKDLLSELKLDSYAYYGAEQELVAAFTHPSAGFPRKIFENANGKKDSCIALPGGHGQNFSIMADIYKKLEQEGYRYLYLTNIDNLAALPSPRQIAVLALSKKNASFDFSFRTEADVKGGILAIRSDSHLDCAELGASMSLDDVKNLEKLGQASLFNCATGLFCLKTLNENIPMISQKLPVRITNQNKDSGLYSQGEQLAWEVLGLLDNYIINAVKKQDRFLSAKVFLETLIASAVLDSSKIKWKNDGMKKAALELEEGLKAVLKREYGLHQKNGIWQA